MQFKAQLAKVDPFSLKLKHFWIYEENIHILDISLFFKKLWRINLKQCSGSQTNLYYIWEIADANSVWKQKWSGKGSVQQLKSNHKSYMKGDIFGISQTSVMFCMH